MKISDLIGETTEYDKKQAVEERKPKSWCKSVSAFANGKGGSLIFGVADDDTIIGLADPKKDSETISELIKTHLDPIPQFRLRFVTEEGKTLVVLDVQPGEDTPYYVNIGSVLETFVRIGNQSVPADATEIRRLVLRGKHSSFDSLRSGYRYDDHAFSKLRERYKVWTGNSLTDKVMDSFGIREADGTLTNAGALLADECPIRYSRLFCTHWNGKDKTGGVVDAVDSAEYSGSLISLLDEGMAFVKRNMKTMWKKTPNSRIEMPDYCERSVFEALVNALIHRDYLIIGSEVHIDIFDDRMSIYSPGGMPDGTQIQDLDINEIPSTRRNPVLADIFSRLGYMERQGSGLEKIIDTYENAHNFAPGMEPTFFSNRAQFTVTLRNLNIGTAGYNQGYNPGYNDTIHENEILNAFLNAIKEDPKISQRRFSEKTGYSKKRVQTAVETLTSEGMIERIGGTRGYWKINE